MSLFEGLYEETHKDNRIFIKAKKINHTNYYNNKINNNDCPDLKIYFDLYHSIVPENNHDMMMMMTILPEYRVFSREFHFSSAAAAEPLVHHMLEAIPIPFDLDGQGNQLRWSSGDSDNDECSLRGINDLAERIAGEIRRSLTSPESAEVGIVIRKRTVVALERYRAMVLPDYDENDDCL